MMGDEEVKGLVGGAWFDATAPVGSGHGIRNKLGKW